MNYQKGDRIITKVILYYGIRVIPNGSKGIVISCSLSSTKIKFDDPCEAIYCPNKYLRVLSALELLAREAE